MERKEITTSQTPDQVMAFVKGFVTGGEYARAKLEVDHNPITGNDRLVVTIQIPNAEPSSTAIILPREPV